MDITRKRNLSELSDFRTPSPLKKLAKTPKTNLDLSNLECKISEVTGQDLGMDCTNSSLKEMSMELKG